MAREVAVTGDREVAVTREVKISARPRLWHSKAFRERMAQVLAMLLVAIGAGIILVPVAWMVSTSLKTQNTVVSLPPDFIPRQSQSVEVNGQKLYLYDVTIDGETRVLAAVKLDPEKSEFVDPDDPSQIYHAPASQARKHKMVWAHWENYVETWTFATTPFGVFMKNTTIYALVAVFGEVLTCSLVAYGFARLRAPGKNFLFMLLLGTMMLPWAVTMIPSYVLFTKYIPDFLNGLLDTKIKLADTWLPLMIPKFFGSAYLIFLIRQFYMGIHKDYDDAARIDGCGFFQTWWRIIIPMSRPVLTAVAILSFMYHWNDYGGPLIYLSTTEKLPLSVGLANFSEAYGGTPYHLMMAASLIAVAPLVAIFFALNRYFVQGVVVSGVKG
jgi:multiple sugar transport system permease protein